MSEPVQKKRGLKKKSNEEEDPVNGLKFDEPDLSSKDQSDALHFRGKLYSKLVIANSSETRAKSTISIAFWIDEVVKSHVPQSKGKHFINMGHSGKTEEGKPTVWLYAEETLWMLEHGHIQLLNEKGEQIHRKWLWERLFCQEISGVTPQHYSAYCHLRNSGYVARRWKKRAPTPELSLQNQDCWNDVSSKEEGVENGYVVFEVWPPSMAAGFRRKDPPKCHWRVLPWKLESDCFPAECWSKAAGVGAMIALSGHAGTRCSFFQVVGTSVQANTFRNEKNAKRKNSAKNVSKDKNKEKEIAKMNKKRKEEKKNESRNAKSNVNEVQTKKWFPTISQWSNQVTDD